MLDNARLGPLEKVRALVNAETSALELLDPEREPEKVALFFGAKPEILRRKRRNFTSCLAAYCHLVRNCPMTGSATAKALSVSSSALCMGIAGLQKRLRKDKI